MRTHTVLKSSSTIRTSIAMLVVKHIQFAGVPMCHFLHNLPQPSYVLFFIDLIDAKPFISTHKCLYLKAVLFNAPSTIDSYYTSLVAHDMASGALAPRKPKYGDLDYYTYNEGESL